MPRGIEIPISLRVSRSNRHEADEEDEEDCPICMRPLCDNEDAVCARAPVTVPCCHQDLCAGCLFKLPLKKCLCVSDCDAVIGRCPFCREMVGNIGPLDVLMGAGKECGACAKLRKREAARRDPQVESVASAHIDTMSDATHPATEAVE